MTKNNWDKIIFAIIISAIIFVTGFNFGRKTVKDAPTTVIDHYIQLPAIHDTTVVTKPKYIKVPADTAKIIEQCIKDGIYTELFPEKIIEKEIYLTSEDTLAIVVDWATARNYEETILDNDTVGKLDISAEIQYNRLKFISYDLQLVQKQTEIENVKTFKYEPFAGISVFTNNTVQGQIGTYIHGKFGVSLNYSRDLTNKQNNFGLGLNYKF